MFDEIVEGRREECISSDYNYHTFYANVGEKLMESIKTLYCTPSCSALHCLMFEKIDKMKIHKKTLKSDT